MPRLSRPLKRPITALGSVARIALSMRPPLPLFGFVLEPRLARAFTNHRAFALFFLFALLHLIRLRFLASSLRCSGLVFAHRALRPSAWILRMKRRDKNTVVPPRFPLRTNRSSLFLIRPPKRAMASGFSTAISFAPKTASNGPRLIMPIRRTGRGPISFWIYPVGRPATSFASPLTAICRSTARARSVLSRDS